MNNVEAEKLFKEKISNVIVSNGEIMKESQKSFNQLGEYLVNLLNPNKGKYIFTEEKGLVLEATNNFIDSFGKFRRKGDIWLLTIIDAREYEVGVNEKLLDETSKIFLNVGQYCVILDPFDKKTGKPQMGAKQLRRGEQSFFLLPGERLESGIQAVYVLEIDEALLLRAREASDDGPRQPGDQWMIYGPCDYVPPVEVEIVERIKID